MIFRLNLVKADFKLMQNSTSKLQCNDFLISRSVVSSCSWWLSHHCLRLVLWTFYLVRLTFLVYLSQGIRATYFFTCLASLQLFSGEPSWIVHDTIRCVQWYQMIPSYLLYCLTEVQFSLSILFSLISQYIYHCTNDPNGTLQDNY